MPDTTKYVLTYLAYYLGGLMCLGALALLLMVAFGNETIHNPYSVFGLPFLYIACHPSQTDPNASRIAQVKAYVIACLMLILITLQIGILDHYTLGSLPTLWDGALGILTTGPVMGLLKFEFGSRPALASAPDSVAVN
ncbi:MAG: hypothetical protein HKN47_12350 [Pirellulaceae bacterium]|nr:hypothetical protein [Pirellulaceae bacterium]